MMLAGNLNLQLPLLGAIPKVLDTPFSRRLKCPVPPMMTGSRRNEMSVLAFSNPSTLDEYVWE